MDLTTSTSLRWTTEGSSLWTLHTSAAATTYQSRSLTRSASSASPSMPRWRASRHPLCIVPSGVQLREGLPACPQRQEVNPKALLRASMLTKQVGLHHVLLYLRTSRLYQSGNVKLGPKISRSVATFRDCAAL